MVGLDLALGIGAELAEAFAGAGEDHNFEEDHDSAATDSLDQGRNPEEVHNSRNRRDWKDDRGDGAAT